jgi:hypothetical protein
VGPRGGILVFIWRSGGEASAKGPWRISTRLPGAVAPPGLRGTRGRSRPPEGAACQVRCNQPGRSGRAAAGGWQAPAGTKGCVCVGG